MVNYMENSNLPTSMPKAGITKATKQINAKCFKFMRQLYQKQKRVWDALESPPVP